MFHSYFVLTKIAIYFIIKPNPLYNLLCKQGSDCLSQMTVFFLHPLNWFSRPTFLLLCMSDGIGWFARIIFLYQNLIRPIICKRIKEKKKLKSFQNTTSMRSVTHLFISDKLQFDKECQKTGSSRLINNRRVRLPKWNMYLTFPTGATINQNTRESDIMMTIKATCHQSYNRTHTSFDF